MKSLFLFAFCLIVFKFASAMELAKTNWSNMRLALDAVTATNADTSANVDIIQMIKQRIERWESDANLRDYLKELDATAYNQRPIVLFQYGDSDSIYYASIFLTDKGFIFSKYNSQIKNSAMPERLFKTKLLNPYDAKRTKYFREYANLSNLESDARNFIGKSGDITTFAGTTSGPILFYTVWDGSVSKTMVFYGIPVYPSANEIELYKDFFKKYGALAKILKFSAYILNFTIWESKYSGDM